MTQSSSPDKAAFFRGGDSAASDVSVIMVSYRTGPVLSAAIESVLAPDQEGVIELILIDNGNPPEVTAELARRAETEPRLTLVSGHGNVGFARGCNIGAGRASARHLLLLNPDCRLGPGAVPALLAETTVLGDNWMLGCRVLNPDGSDQRASRRALLTPLTALVEMFRLDRLAPRLFHRHRLKHHENPLPDGTDRVPAISGACMMLPAATYHAVGGLDEGYLLHGRRPRLLPSAGSGRDPGLFRAARGGDPPHQQQPSESDPHRVAQDSWLPALLHACTTEVCAGFSCWDPLGAGVLARFGVKVMQSLLRSAWKWLALLALNAPVSARSETREPQATTRPEGTGSDSTLQRE